MSEEFPSFMKPYADAGHDLHSLFNHKYDYKCKLCNAYQVDLTEDLIYGTMRPCKTTQEAKNKTTSI